MTAKDFLETYKHYSSIEEKRYNAYSEARDRLYNISSSLGHIGEPRNGNYRDREDAIIKMQTRREAWAAAALDALEVRQNIFDLIYDIEGAAGDVLYQRYLQLGTWEDVCKAVDMSRTQIHRVHSDALQIVQERIDKLSIG